MRNKKKYRKKNIDFKYECSWSGEGKTFLKLLSLLIYGDDWHAGGANWEAMNLVDNDREADFGQTFFVAVLIVVIFLVAVALVGKNDRVRVQ